MSPEAVATTAVDITDYLDVMRRRWKLIAGSVLACLLLFVALSLAGATSYLSKAEIALPDPTTTVSANQGQADILTEVAVLKSDEIAVRVASAISGRATVAELKSHLVVATPSAARILTIGYKSDSAQSAQRGAQAYADAYIAYKVAQAKAQIEAQSRPLRAAVEVLDTQIKDTQAALAKLSPDSVEYRNTQSTLAIQQTQRATQQIALSTQEATPISPGTVITPAILPTAPVATGVVKKAIVGVMLGLAIGLVAAFVLERFDKQVREPADIEQMVGATTLGSVPLFPEFMRRPPFSLVSVYTPDGPHADSFRRVRTSFLIAAEATKARVVGITSAARGEGKSTVAANLATTLAQSGRSVLLISGDLRRPTIEEVFEIPHEPGLVDVLLGERSLTEAIVRSNDLLAILAEGSRHRHPTDLLQSQAMASLLDEARKDFDFVIVDTPPVLAVADVLAIASMLDAVALVVSVGETTETQVTDAETQLRDAGGVVLGTIVNRSGTNTQEYERYSRPEGSVG